MVAGNAQTNAHIGRRVVPTQPTAAEQRGPLALRCGGATGTSTSSHHLPLPSPSSPGFQRFVNVLVDMTGAERKAFLQFTTGCSSLPPGGLANLHPRLTVVRKVDASDGSFPSVNTCAHYLKLPDYSSEALLRERLLAATREKGFHLN